MADNVTFTNTGTGAVPNSTVVRTRQTASGYHIQVADVAPLIASPVSGGQYALAVGTSSPVTLTVPSGATHAFVSNDTVGANIRWTRDGTAPTSTVGHILQPGESMEIDNLSNFRMISTSGTVAVQVSYHRYV